MMDDTHIHIWATDYTELDWNKGVRCACGATLDQVEVENALNDYERMKAAISSSGVAGLCKCGHDEKRHHHRVGCCVTDCRCRSYDAAAKNGHVEITSNHDAPPPPVPKQPTPQLITIGDGSPRTRLVAFLLFFPIGAVLSCIALWLIFG